MQASLLNGDPRRLLHGFDYRGRLCGVDHGVEQQPLVYWPDPNQPEYPICMGKCPNTTGEIVMLPVDSVSRDKVSDDFVSLTITSTRKKIETYPSKMLLWRYCVPSSQFRQIVAGYSVGAVEGIDLTHRHPALVSQVTRSLADLQAAIPVLALAVPVAMMLGYAYLLLLRGIAPLIIWGLLLGLIIVCVGFSSYCFRIAGQEDGSSVLVPFDGKDSAQWARVIGSLSGFLGMAIITLVWCVRRSVSRAVGCVQAACDAMWSLPSLLVLPGFEVVCKLTYVFCGLVGFGWVLSNGDIASHGLEVKGDRVIHGMQRSLTHSTLQQGMVVYYIFGFIWGLEIIAGVFQFVVAHAVASWYFTECREDASKPPIPCPTWKGLWKVMRFHLGSVALGSLLLALTRFIHGFLEYIASQARSARANRVADCIAANCVACIWCFEMVVRFLNQNAYFEMSIHGADFFTSASTAANLLLEGAPEVVVLRGMTFVFQCIGSAIVSACTAFLALEAMTGLPPFASHDSMEYIRSPPLAAGAAGLIALMTATAFMTLFDTVADVLLYCWLVDRDENKDQKILYAPGPLRNLLTSGFCC